MAATLSARAFPAYALPAGFQEYYILGHETHVLARPDKIFGRFRTDGEFAPASVLKPVANKHNQWQFQMPGIKIPGNQDVELPAALSR